MKDVPLVWFHLLKFSCTAQVGMEESMLWIFFQSIGSPYLITNWWVQNTPNVPERCSICSLHSYAVVCDSSQSDRSCMFFL